MLNLNTKQVPDSKTEGSQSIKAVLVDEEAVGSVGSPGCGAKILKGDDVPQQHFEEAESNVSVVQHVLDLDTRIFCES